MGDKDWAGAGGGAGREAARSWLRDGPLGAQQAPWSVRGRKQAAGPVMTE